MIFKVKGQGHRIKFSDEGIRHALVALVFESHIDNSLGKSTYTPTTLTKDEIGTYLVLRRVWNPIDF